MTEVVQAPQTPTNDVIGTGAAVEGSAPVLITEQQVMFATAAVQPATGAGQPKRHGGPVSWLRGITRLFPTAKDEKAPDGERRTPRDGARRYSYIENAAMAREMDRL